MKILSGGWRELPTWALLTAGGLLVVVALSSADMPGWAVAATIGCTIGALGVLTAYPLIGLGFGVVLAVGAAQAITNAVPPWTVAICGIAGTLCALAGRRIKHVQPALLFLAAGGLAGLPFNTMPSLTAVLLACVIPWLIGRYARQQAELARAGAETAKWQERTRIAHDMHDSLGHDLSLLAVRASVLQMSPDLAERHRLAAGELRQGAAEAIDRLAAILGMLRDSSEAPLTPATGGVTDLVDRASAAGMAVSLDWQEDRSLTSIVDRAVHRVVQEALTNAAKHAAGAAVAVSVTAFGGQTVVTVTNGPPKGRSHTAGGARTGLIALEERVRMCGGTLSAGPRDGGFEVAAHFPYLGVS